MNITHKRINELLYEKRLTQTGLAEACGITQSTLSRNLNGVHSTRVDLIMQIADFFDVSVDYLLGRTDERKPETKIIEKLIPVVDNNNIQNISPLANTQIYKEIVSIVNRLTENELYILKGVLIGIVGKEIPQSYKSSN